MQRHASCLGLFPARAGACERTARAEAKCRPSPGEAQARTVLTDRFQLQGQSAAERRGWRRKGAALRPGRLRATSRFTTDFSAKHFGCCGLLRPSGRKFRIQYSKFRITNSGRSLRSTQVRQRTAGLRRPQAAARRPLARSIPTQNHPHSRADGLATLEKQPSARGGCGLPTSTTSNLLAGIFLQNWGGCGLPVAARPILLQNTSVTTGSCGPHGPDGPTYGIDSIAKPSIH